MLLHKALVRIRGIPQERLSYQKVSTLALLLRHPQTCQCVYHWSPTPLTPNTLLPGQAVPKLSETCLCACSLSHARLQSSSTFQSFHRSQLLPIFANVLQKAEYLFPNRKSRYWTKRPWHMSGVRKIHTSDHRKDIPEYLQGSISEVASVDDDLFDNDEVKDDLYYDMEDDIIDFFTSHLISYEETDTSFSVHCPTCSTKEGDTQVQEIFVDKNSGYFVCPWCNRDGPWEDLVHLLNSREDCLSMEQLKAYMATTLPITDIGENLLQDSPLKNVSIHTLKKFGARVTNDESRVIIPVANRQGEVIGFESISLLHYFPQVIRRFIKEEEVKAFSVMSSSRKEDRVIVVPTCCDVLVLAEHNIPAVSLPSANAEVLAKYLLDCGKIEVVLWYRGEAPPRPLLLSLIEAGVSCSLVHSSLNDRPIHTKPVEEIKAALRATIPVVSESITTFQQLKDKIYHRITHKEETCGVQWKRFVELNTLLLGHRAGEMTVLTGPTGSGKTTFMAEYSLDLCSQGVKTLWGSFEVSVVRLCEVMLQQFSGVPLPQDLTNFNTLASQFSILPLHFLTYHGQQSIATVIEMMTKAVKVWGIQHVIIDNLQFMLGTCEEQQDRWWEQDRAVTAIRRFATLNNCHVTLVVHPKKVPEGQPLGIGSVFGGVKVTQEADNVLILQVKTGSSINRSRKMLQVVKNRFAGQLGEFSLKFHKDSLTLSSCFRHKSKDRTVEAENKSKTSLRKIKIKGISAFEN